ncbi:cupin domain-containing protein [Microbacterium terregens]|uniref:Cupin domain-containing protein n=1 Tax=Microbacterium terregens TaxID=69363 RepID=A0ABV5T3J1_9MICO
MIVIRPHEQVGAQGKTGSRFTGDVYPYLTGSVDGVTVNTVTFSPGARTHWHAHESGQILLVLAGSGLVQSAGGRVEVLHAGDTVWSPAGESHWHGAASDSLMTHIAISLGTTSWAAPVADHEFVAPTPEVTP